MFQRIKSVSSWIWQTSWQKFKWLSYRVVAAQSLYRVTLFDILWTAARQALLSFTIPQSLLRFMSIESVMQSNHLILCCLLLLLPLIFSSIRVFSNESALHIRWAKYWSFGFNISPSNEYSGLISFRINHWTTMKIQELQAFLTPWVCTVLSL